MTKDPEQNTFVLVTAKIMFPVFVVSIIANVVVGLALLIYGGLTESWAGIAAGCLIAWFGYRGFRQVASMSQGQNLQGAMLSHLMSAVSRGKESIQ